VAVRGSRLQPSRRHPPADHPAKRRLPRPGVPPLHPHAAELLSHPSGLRSRGQGEDRPAGRQVLEELVIEELRTLRMRDQQQCVALPLERNGAIAGETPREEDPSRSDVAVELLSLTPRNGPGDHELELRRDGGALTGERGPSLPEPRRRAPAPDPPR